MTTWAKEANATAYRLRPTTVNGLLVVVGYGVLLIAMQKVSGVSYTAIGESTSNIVKAVLLPVLLGSVALTGFALWSGWWRDVWVDRYKITGHAWMLLMPVLLLATIVVTLTAADFGAHGADYWLALAAGVALVGYSEELLIRGLLVRAMRGSGLNDLRILAASSIIFGLLHGLNFFSGQDFSTTRVQVGATALIGGYLYVTLRRTGFLIVPVVLHALWDFAIFASGATGNSVATGLGEPNAHSRTLAILGLGLEVLLIASAIVIWRRGRKAAPDSSESAPLDPAAPAPS